MSNSSNYRIKIVREGTEFEVQGDKKFVLEMIKRFELSESGDVKGDIKIDRGKMSVKNLEQRGKAIGVGEFIRQTGFKKHTDITLAFGYYLETYSEKHSFAPSDINACYYEAKMEASNTSQMIILNIRRGYMMKSGKGKDKNYTLTQSGLDYVKSKSKK